MSNKNSEATQGQTIHIKRSRTDDRLSDLWLSRLEEKSQGGTGIAFRHN
jgi:hypothetical protein